MKKKNRIRSILLRWTRQFNISLFSLEIPWKTEYLLLVCRCNADVFLTRWLSNEQWHQSECQLSYSVWWTDDRLEDDNDSIMGLVFSLRVQRLHMIESDIISLVNWTGKTFDHAFVSQGYFRCFLVVRRVSLPFNPSFFLSD